MLLHTQARHQPIHAQLHAQQHGFQASICSPSSSGKRPSLPLYLAKASAMYTVYDVNRSMTPCRREHNQIWVHVQGVQCSVPAQHFSKVQVHP